MIVLSYVIFYHAAHEFISNVKDFKLNQQLKPINDICIITSQWSREVVPILCYVREKSYR